MKLILLSPFLMAVFCGYSCVSDRRGKKKYSPVCPSEQTLHQHSADCLLVAVMDLISKIWCIVKYEQQGNFYRMKPHNCVGWERPLR